MHTFDRGRIGIPGRDRQQRRGRQHHGLGGSRSDDAVAGYIYEDDEDDQDDDDDDDDDDGDGRSKSSLTRNGGKDEDDQSTDSSSDNDDQDEDEEEVEAAVKILDSVCVGSGARITDLAVWSYGGRTNDDVIDTND